MASVNSALQRARRAVDERLREVVGGYMDAWERADVDAVAAMLAADAPPGASAALAR